MVTYVLCSYLGEFISFFSGCLLFSSRLPYRYKKVGTKKAKKSVNILVPVLKRRNLCLVVNNKSRCKITSPSFSHFIFLAIRYITGAIFQGAIGRGHFSRGVYWPGDGLFSRGAIGRGYFPMWILAGVYWPGCYFPGGGAIFQVGYFPGWLLAGGYWPGGGAIIQGGYSPGDYCPGGVVRVAIFRVAIAQGGGGGE